VINTAGAISARLAELQVDVFDKTSSFDLDTTLQQVQLTCTLVSLSLSATAALKSWHLSRVRVPVKPAHSVGQSTPSCIATVGEHRAGLLNLAAHHPPENQHQPQSRLALPEVAKGRRLAPSATRPGHTTVYRIKIDALAGRSKTTYEQYPKNKITRMREREGSQSIQNPPFSLDTL